MTPPAQSSPCYVPLTLIVGTGFNTVDVPNTEGSQYKAITEQLLYEIWQALLLLVAANPPAVTKIISFDIGDGQAGTPIAGTTELNIAAFNGQNLFNVNLLVVRNGIELPYSSPVTTATIRRINTGATGGFAFEPASGFSFQPGEHYDLYVVGINTSIAA